MTIPWKLSWEWKLATFIYEYTNHQFLQFQLKARPIFYKMESAIQFQAAFSFCLSSAIKKVSVDLLHNQPAFDLACGVSAAQSRLTLAAWRYPWRYCNASAFRLVLSMDRTLPGHAVDSL